MLDEVDSGLDVDGITTYVDEVKDYASNNETIMMFAAFNLDVINKINLIKYYTLIKTVSVKDIEFLQTVKVKGPPRTILKDSELYRWTGTLKI